MLISVPVTLEDQIRELKANNNIIGQKLQIAVSCLSIIGQSNSPFKQDAQIAIRRMAEICLPK